MNCSESLAPASEMLYTEHDKHHIWPNGRAHLKPDLRPVYALLPVTAGAADVKELNLADGYIIIRPNEYVVSGSGLLGPQPAAEKYIISAKGTLDTVLKRGRF